MTPHQHPNRAIGAMTADFSRDDTLSLCFPLKRISSNLLCLAKKCQYEATESAVDTTKTSGSAQSD